jgi:uncharacterized protein YmfQ (DUF2313 family)
MPPPVFTKDMFRSAFMSLLPTGPIWPRSESSVLYQLSGVWAASFARSSDRAINLLVDAFPSTTTELLAEWEATLGLPDPCAGTNPSIAQRRAQVVARLTDTNGCSVAYFVAFAKALGYDITITQFAPRRFGARFGTPFGGEAWAYAWQVNVPQFTVNRLKFGDSFGQPWAQWNNNVLQCEMKARAPAHTILLFNYEN